MKRIQLERWSGQLLFPRSRPCCLKQVQAQAQVLGRRRIQSSAASQPTQTYASPLPEQALQSAKLGALHARLGLSPKLPLQTMARTLVDPSADPNPDFNNSALAQVGGPFLSYYVAEWLLCHYPRLPMSVLFAATYAYNGPPTLAKIGKEWGVESAAYPGSEVDPGLLQFNKMVSGTALPSIGATTRPDAKDFYRRGWSSRNVYDDEFGDQIKFSDSTVSSEPLVQPTDTAYSNFVKAIIGAIYLHSGRDAAKKFVESHVLSRQLAMSTLFRFKMPVRELARLCQREGFEYPIARILSETGRHSRTPVFVVGIYSGADKLGEGAAPNLVEARLRAAVAALKAWYLYSPGSNVRVPSDTEELTAKPWEPVHIDVGEVIH